MRVFRIESRIIFWRGNIWSDQVLHQRPLFGGDNLEAPRLSAVFCRYTTPTIPYLVTTYVFCFRVTPTTWSHGCKKIPLRNNTECWLEAELRRFMSKYGVLCQSNCATFDRLTPSQAEASARQHRHPFQAFSLIVCL